jgi:nicotinate-nucleotide adenylyltransferase
LPPPSYTLHTLEALAERHPGHEFHLVIGADTLADLPNWHRPADVLARAGLVAVHRPGAETWTADRLAAAVGVPPAAVRLAVVESPLVDVSSRGIRARVAAGKTVRFLVPRSVEEFVRERGLYRG